MDYLDVIKELHSLKQRMEAEEKTRDANSEGTNNDMKWKSVTDTVNIALCTILEVYQTTL